MGVFKSPDFIDFQNVLFPSICKSPELFMFIDYMRQTLKVPLISNVAAVYSFDSFYESIT